MEEYGRIALELLVGFVALFLYTKLLGKAHFSQLTPFDFISVLVLGELLGNAVYDREAHIGHVLFSTGLWGLLILSIVMITQKRNGSRKFLEGEPSVVIRNGILDYEAMKRCRLDLNELQTMLRQKNMFSMAWVEYAIMETNGALSVLPKSKYDSPVRYEFGLPERQTTLPVSLILDGQLMRDNLPEAGVDEAWLRERLAARGIARVEDVFFAEWNGDEHLYVCCYGEQAKGPA